MWRSCRCWSVSVAHNRGTGPLRVSPLFFFRGEIQKSAGHLSLETLAPYGKPSNFWQPLPRADAEADALLANDSTEPERSLPLGRLLFERLSGLREAGALQVPVVAAALMTMLSILATAHRISRPISLIGRRPVTLANGQPYPSTRRREPSWSDSAGVREAIAFFDRLPSLAAGVKEHTHPVEIVEVRRVSRLLVGCVVSSLPPTPDPAV